MLEKLKKLEQKSLSRKIPIITHKKAVWLYDQVVAVKPKRVLELGTAVGYSGCLLGSQGAELVTVEKDVAHAEEAKENFKEFNIHASVIVGDASEVLPKLVKADEEFDLIFIDHAKQQYFPVLEQCIRLVKVNGYIIADNITMQGCQDFKEAVLVHPKLETELINIDDGLSCSKRSA